MSHLLQDTVVSFRRLRRNVGFTSVAVVSLALGIAANTTMFSVLDATLLSSIELPDSSRIVYLSTHPHDEPDVRDWVTVPDYRAWKETARSFDALGAMFGGGQSRTLGASQDGRPAEMLGAFQLDRDLLDVFGIEPQLGRLFTADEDVVGEPARVVLLSHRLWQRLFGGDPGVLGSTLVLDGAPATVIGVMPEGLSATLQQPDLDLWIPWSLSPSMVISAVGFNHVYGRLAPGVALEQAQAEMDAIAAQLAVDRPDTNAGRGIRVEPLGEFFFGELRQPLLTLQGAVAIVLLIACANVTVLLLTAAASRQAEVAMRSAIGAGRGRIVRQMLTESLLLALFGGALGLMLAWAGMRLFVAVAPPGLPGLADIALDGRVLVFTALVAVSASVIFGIVPALSGSRPDLASLLNETPRGTTGGGRRNRMRLALVTGQTAMALILLVSAGLLINSLLRLQANSLGADPANVLSFRLGFPLDQAITYTGEQFRGVGLWEVNPNVLGTFEAVIERLEAVAGVESVAGGYVQPFTGALPVPFQRAGQPAADAAESTAAYFSITPDYFDVLRVPVLKGRAFADDDRDTSRPVAIINEAMAKRFWPDEDPIGRFVTVDYVPKPPSREIVGVVGDTLLNRFEESPTPAIYVPYAQQTPVWQGPNAMFVRGGMNFIVRTAGDPLSFIRSISSAVAEVDPGKPMLSVQSVEQILGSQLQETRLYTVLLVTFGGLAGVLAAVGLYGVIAYSVAERGREIGIRVALGAGGGNVLSLVLTQAAIVIGAGIALGIVGSLAATRLLGAALWGVTPTDPVTFVLVSLGLLTVALAACVVPARRALALDPVRVLRKI